MHPIDHVLTAIAEVANGHDENALIDERLLGSLQQASDVELTALLDGLHELDLASDRPALDVVLSAVLHQLAMRLRTESPLEGCELPVALRDRLARLFEQLSPVGMARAYLLQVLATARDPASLAEFARLWATGAPSDSRAAAIALGPLFQFQDYDPEPLFPRLFDTSAQPAAAAGAIDLANFAVRQQLLAVHPASDRQRVLVGLLGELTQRLSVLEELRDQPRESAQRLAEQVEDAVSLAVSLCDALALIGDASATGKLYQAMDLSHRRLRTEAAAALARFGEEQGTAMLVSMAAHPVTRLRVLAYADELGLSDRIDPQYATSAARAEAELALWLAQPSQLGIPPTDLELVDCRTLYWPGYDEPLECFLFRFAYRVGEAEYSNIAVVGPATHAFAADLADLPPDDIYAAFAGWQAEHEEIFEIRFESLNEPQRVEVARLERRLRDHGYDDIQPVLLGSFFGERSLVTRATRRSAPCIAIADPLEVLSFTAAATPRALGPAEAYAIYKGRKLLRSFNT